jgi:holliday junction DNA helicase RuvA
MIGSIRGTVVDRSAKGDVIIETSSGVGYRLTVSATTLSAVIAAGSESVFLFVHTHVREDALQLFGFGGRDERITFELLISTHGVGPSLALAILSAHTPSSLRTAVAAEDVAALTLVPGVGNKTAARLLIELKSKFDGADLDLPAALVTAGAGLGAKAIGAETADPRHDVRAALGELGYGAEEVKAVLRQLPAVGESPALLRQALGLLAEGVRS